MKNEIEYIDLSIKQTFITPEGKKVKRMIQHVGQGFDEHVIYKGLKYKIEHIEGNLWKMVGEGRIPGLILFNN